MAILAAGTTGIVGPRPVEAGVDCRALVQALKEVPAKVISLVRHRDVATATCLALAP